MVKKNTKNVSKIANDILSHGPSNDSIIDSILNEQSKENDDIVLRMSTSNVSYEAFKGKGSKLNVVKQVKPNCKTAGKDFNKLMTKKEALKEIISSVMKDFFDNDKKCKEFIKELK